MTIWIKQETGERRTKQALAAIGISATDESDLTPFGFATLEMTPEPEPVDGFEVVEGPDEEYAPGHWRQTWVQTPVEAPVPQVVSRAQGKAALIHAGLWPAVLAWVAAIQNPTERALAEVALHDTQEWRRHSPTMLSAASGLGMSDEQMDALFTLAATQEF